MSNIENLKNDLSAFAAFADNVKAGTEEKKSLGARIAETICLAYRENDTQTIAYIDSQREEGNSHFKAAKSYVSKAVKVGRAFQSGLFTENDTEKSVSTLYDLLKEREEKAKNQEKMLSEKRANENAALLELFGNDQSAVNDFIIAADPIEYQATLSQALLEQGERLAQEKAESLKNQAGEKVTEVKAFIDYLFENTPNLFLEVMEYTLSKADELKKAA